MGRAWAVKTGSCTRASLLFLWTLPTAVVRGNMKRLLFEIVSSIIIFTSFSKLVVTNNYYKQPEIHIGHIAKSQEACAFSEVCLHPHLVVAL